MQGLKKRSQGEGIGKSRGGFTSKIHAVTDENGKLIRILITNGSVHDSTQAKNLLDKIIHKGVYVIGDRAYDSSEIINYVKENNGIAVIPPRKNRKMQSEYNKEIYKDRNKIERFFNRLKNFRRIATRYDKLVLSFISFIQLAAILIIIPKFSDFV